VSAVASRATARSPVTFDAALGLAEDVPRVAAATRAVQEKTGVDRNVAALPYNPQIAVQPGWRLEPRDARQPEIIVEVLQPWNLSGYGAARQRTVSVEEEVLRAESRAAALAARLGAARAWIELWTAEHLVEEVRREETIAGELERLVGRAASLGAMTRADLAEAAAYHAEARVAVLVAEGEVFQRGLALGRELADRDALPLHTTGEPPAPWVPSEARRTEFLDRAAALPLVSLRELQTHAARARELEELRARGTLAQFGAVLQRDAPGGLVVSGIARVTIPVFERGERERGSILAEAARLEGEQRDALIAARVEIALSFHEVSHSAEVLAVLRDDLVPASRQAAETRRRIFEQGGATLLEVLQSDRAAVAAASRLWRVQAEHAWARTKLWLLLAEATLRDQRKASGS
jgi:cobalt-zinc-cadmium efflux system outer membrane protein